MEAVLAGDNKDASVDVSDESDEDSDEGFLRRSGGFRWKRI